MGATQNVCCNQNDNEVRIEARYRPSMDYYKVPVAVNRISNFTNNIELATNHVTGESLAHPPPKTITGKRSLIQISQANNIRSLLERQESSLNMNMLLKEDMSNLEVEDREKAINLTDIDNKYIFSPRSVHIRDKRTERFHNLILEAEFQDVSLNKENGDSKSIDLL